MSPSHSQPTIHRSGVAILINVRLFVHVDGVHVAVQSHLNGLLQNVAHGNSWNFT